MKLKITILGMLMFCLVGCPSKKEDSFIRLDSLSVNSSCVRNEISIKDTVKCDDEFKIYLDFSSSLIANMNFSTKNIGSANAGIAYAAYEPETYLKNRVERYSILNTEKFEKDSANKDLSRYFNLIVDDSKWVNELPILEAINECILLQYNSNTRSYLKFNSNSNFTYSGKFNVVLELSDGSLLSDSTGYVIIN